MVGDSGPRCYFLRMTSSKEATLITGASSGIGRALAEEYARRGHPVALLARRRDRLEALAAELKTQYGVKAVPVVADLSDTQQQEAAIRSAREQLGPLGIVVANAGNGVGGAFEGLATQDFIKQYRVNVWGLLDTVRLCLPDLQETRGRLALVGSVMSYLSLPGSTPYSMSKFAVRALAEGLFVELAPFGISVTLISPGFVESEIRRLPQGTLQAPAAEAARLEKDPVPRFLQMPARKAARKIYRAVRARRRERILTLHGRLGVWGALYFHGPVLQTFRVIQILAKRFGKR